MSSTEVWLSRAASGVTSSFPLVHARRDHYSLLCAGGVDAVMASDHLVRLTLYHTGMKLKGEGGGALVAAPRAERADRRPGVDMRVCRAAGLAISALERPTNHSPDHLVR
jgi:hypothetical protein